MKTTIYNPEQTANYIIALYEQYGNEDYIGEPVSQMEHMCQCAMLAEQEGYDEEVILAAFFHDLGHFCEHMTDLQLMDGYGIVDHEKLGADFLRVHRFSEKIAVLVENHVHAKRYLTYRDQSYYDKLSDASKKTLEFQGGKMNDDEAIEFASRPHFELNIKLRRWDEMAKIEAYEVPALEKYRKMIIHHLSKK